MKDFNETETALAGLVRASWESMSIPALNTLQIEQRALAITSPGQIQISGDPARKMRHAFASVLAIAVLVMFLNPQSMKSVSAAIAALRYKTYFSSTLPNGTVTENSETETTLDIVRKHAGFGFIAPAGMPIGSRIVSVSSSADPAHPRVSIIYRSPQGAVFSIRERPVAVSANSPRPRCFVIQGSPIAFNAIPASKRANLTGPLPRGIRSLPCAVDIIKGVRVDVSGLNGPFVGAAILRAMR